MTIFRMSLEEINVTISSGSVNVLPEKFTTVLPGSLENEFLVHATLMHTVALAYIFLCSYRECPTLSQWSPVDA